MVLELEEFGPQDNSEWVGCVRLWEMVACLKLQLAGGRNKEVKAVTSGTQGGCGAGRTWQVTRWFDGTKQRSKKGKRRRTETTHQTTDVCWRVTLLVTVLWCDLGRARERRLDWLLLMWRDMMPGRGRGSGPKPPFILTPLLYLSFSHMHTHKHPQSVSFIALFLALSILSVLPCCHPLSFAP